MAKKEPDDPTDFEEVKEERRLLNLLRVRSFTINPATIEPFQQATASWDVFVPPAVSSAISVRFTFAGADVLSSGSKVVSPLQTAAFLLDAISPLTRRNLGSKAVHVEGGDCQEASLPRASIEFQAQTAKDLFRAGTLSSRGDLSVSMFPPKSLFIEVPLKASIPNFFDADIDIDLTIEIKVVTRSGGRREIVVTLADVDVDVIFSLKEHILLFGAATAAQALIQPLAADLIKSFLGPQIEAAIAAPIQTAINFFTEGWKANDPEKRNFRLFSVTAEPEGLVIVGCPLPKPPAPPPPPPVIGVARKRGSAKKPSRKRRA